MFHDAVPGVRGPAHAIVMHGHALTMLWMPRNGGADVAFGARHHATDDGEVDFLHRSPGKLIRERDMGFVILGHHQAAAGFLVEPMDDARSRHAADAAELPGAMMEERIDQRVRLIARRGMHHQTGGLVQNEQRVVFKNDIERDVFRLRFGGPGCGPFDLHDFAGARRVRGFGFLTVDLDIALRNEPLNRPARGGGEFAAQESIEPFAGAREFNRQSFRARSRHELRLENCRLLVAAVA